MTLPRCRADVKQRYEFMMSKSHVDNCFKILANVRDLVFRTQSVWLHGCFNLLFKVWAESFLACLEGRPNKAREKFEIAIGGMSLPPRQEEVGPGCCIQNLKCSQGIP